jgi:hypothetical protein
MRLAIVLAALLACCGCFSMQGGGPNGSVCRTEGYSLPFYANADTTCRDATGKVVSSWTLGAQP